MISEKQLAKLRKIALYARLSGRNLLYAPECSNCCNGIGAEWFPEKLRLFVTRLHPTLLAAACVHDCRYTLGGDEADRKRADEEFYQNCLRLARYRYRVDQLRRYVVRWQAWWLWLLLRVGGGFAYNYTRGAK